MVKPNAAGTDAVLVARYDYDVYGGVRTQSGSSANQFKYVAGVGHPTDEETGLIYMRAQYYEPGTGRFVSEDPEMDGNNCYAYVADNPTNFIDPDGKLIWSVQALVRFFLSSVIVPVLVKTGVIGQAAATILAWAFAIATMAAVVLAIVAISATAAIHIISWVSRIEAAMRLTDGDLIDERIAEAWSV